MNDGRRLFEEILVRHMPTYGRRAVVPFDHDLFQLGLDSLSAVRLVLALEEAFGIEFPETAIDVRLFSSAATLERAVSELVAAKGGEAPSRAPQCAPEHA